MPHSPKPGTKRIAPGAYNALLEALSTVFWNKQPFERYLRIALRDHPELLGGLDFTGPKRQAAADLIDRLAEHEDRYQGVTLHLMLELANWKDWTNLRRQVDGAELLETATTAVQQLGIWTFQYGEMVDARDALAAEQAAEEAKSEQRRNVAAVLRELEQRFLAMHQETDHQARGRVFETLLNELFALFDLNPRRSFALVEEQIDGAFTFSTDDYILEAKWEAHPAARRDVDVLAEMVRRKGKNTLGLFIAVSGFSAQAVSAHSNCGSAIMFMDGTDLISVLSGMISLTDALEAKRRHLSETGLPFLMMRDILNQ